MQFLINGELKDGLPFELRHIPKELMLDALDTAYKDVGPKKKGK